MSEEVAARLRRMRVRIESLPDTPTRPTPTLNVIRHGHEENYWNRLLTYFLTPTEPHQLETAVLEAFLSAVGEQYPDFSFSRIGFEDIEVRSEVGTGSGVADLIVHVEGEWFLWIEMKVRSGEHEEQTTRYVDELTLGNGLEKESFPEKGRHYVFLADENKTADAPEFETVGWQSVVRSFEKLLDEYGQFPMQSLAQLNDFCETIRNEIGMIKEKQNRNDLAALAVEYADEIERSNEALESYSEELKETWADELRERSLSGWGSEWEPRTHSRYANIYRPSWHNPPDNEPNAQGTDARFHLFIQHLIGTGELKQGSLQVRLLVAGSNDPLVEEFYERLQTPETAGRIESVVTDISNETGKNGDFYNTPELKKMKIVVVNYEFDFKAGGGYVSTLQTALEDLYPVAEIVDEIYEETVAPKSR